MVAADRGTAAVDRRNREDAIGCRKASLPQNGFQGPACRRLTCAPRRLLRRKGGRGEDLARNKVGDLVDSANGQSSWLDYRPRAHECATAGGARRSRLGNGAMDRRPDEGAERIHASRSSYRTARDKFFGR